MNLFYCEIPGGNFGDDMNLWFWDDLLPGWRDWDKDRLLFGIGTILNKTNLAGDGNILIAGSGIGYGVAEPLDATRVAVGWVRGPKSAHVLGLDARSAITDPACMLPHLERFKAPPPVAHNDVIFVPHCTTAKLQLDWDGLCQKAGVSYVSPKGDAVAVVDRIRSARLVIAESMHAAIVADSFRVPWIPVALTDQFNQFKWDDWASSLDLTVDIKRGLKGPRAIYSIFKKGRALANSCSSAVRRKRTSNNEKPITRQVDVSANRSQGQQAEKEKLKRTIAKFRFIAERMLTNDIRKFQESRPYLSEDKVYNDRVEQVASRLEELKSRYSTTAA